LTIDKNREDTMGRPPIGKKAMSSSERAQRHRNKKRRLANFSKEGSMQREWLLIEAAFTEPTRGILENIFRIGLAAQHADFMPAANLDELFKGWDFIANYLNETMREIASRR
jgi:hypothetical protein